MDNTFVRSGESPAIDRWHCLALIALEISGWAPFCHRSRPRSAEEREFLEDNSTRNPRFLALEPHPRSFSVLFTAEGSRSHPLWPTKTTEIQGTDDVMKGGTYSTARDNSIEGNWSKYSILQNRIVRIRGPRIDIENHLTQYRLARKRERISRADILPSWNIRRLRGNPVRKLAIGLRNAILRYDGRESDRKNFRKNIRK